MFLQFLASDLPEGFLSNFLGGFTGASLSSLLSLFAGLLVVTLIVAVVLYVYSALVWSTIAKKLNYKKPWLAWIPVVQFFLLPILSGYPWQWGFIMLAPLVLGIIPVVGLILSPIAMIFIGVMSIIWMWKIFEKRKYPGWLSLISLISVIPFLAPIAAIGVLVVLGLVAWADRK
jgi:hypothetical protein